MPVTGVTLFVVSSTISILPCLAITFCIVGSACSNQRLLASLDDRYVYECIDDERQAIRSLTETKLLLTQRQLRIYVVDSFDDCIFQSLKENEDIYTISSELVLACAEKEMVTHRESVQHSHHAIPSRTFLCRDVIGLCTASISHQRSSVSLASARTRT